MILWQEKRTRDQRVKIIIRSRGNRCRFLLWLFRTVVLSHEVRYQTPWLVIQESLQASSGEGVLEFSGVISGHSDDTGPREKAKENRAC